MDTDTYRQHKIPLHLETEDTFLWTFTGRQIFVIGLGLTVGYLAFGDVITDITPLTLSIGIVLWVLCAAASVVVALVRVKRRTLEQWAVVWLLYWSRSRYHLWRPQIEETFPNHLNEDDFITDPNTEESTRW